MQNGNIHVDVTDANVTASVGADLAAFTADIDFDVADTAANIAAQIAAGNAAGYGANSLEDAQSVVVESGNPVMLFRQRLFRILLTTVAVIWISQTQQRH